MPGVRRKARGTLEGWGRQSVAGSEVRSEDLVRATRDAPLSRGLGRSYGDASLPPPGAPRAVNTTRADRILAFDERTGRLRAEAGLSLFELNRVLMPRGWFTPVTPGTQFVTLGGMVAADIHGKNQHAAGDFGDHVTALRMRVADGRVRMGRVDGGDQRRPGVYAHHYFGHADGAWLVLYAWLRLEIGLPPCAAYEEAVRRATGARSTIDVSDLTRSEPSA